MEFKEVHLGGPQAALPGSDPWGYHFMYIFAKMLEPWNIVLWWHHNCEIQHYFAHQKSELCFTILSSMHP